MKFPSVFRSSLAFAVAGALLCAAGCSSTPDAKATVGSMSQFGLETAKVKDGIDASLKSLDTLAGTRDEDLKTPYQAYAKSVAALEDQAKVVRAQAEDMQAKGDAYFKAWETEAATPEMSSERKAQLTEAYAKIKDDTIAARDAFQPFLASLKDVQSYLSLDLSRKGIDSVQDLAKKAKANGDVVKAKIETVIQQTNSVRGMLSTKPAG